MPFPPPPASISQRVFMSFYVCRSYSSTSKAFCLPSEKDLSNLCSICLFVSKFVLLPQWFAIEGEAHAVVLALLVVVNHVLEAAPLHEGHPLRRLARLLQRLAPLERSPFPMLHAIRAQELQVQPLLVGVKVLVLLVCHIVFCYLDTILCSIALSPFHPCLRMFSLIHIYAWLFLLFSLVYISQKPL